MKLVSKHIDNAIIPIPKDLFAGFKKFTYLKSPNINCSIFTCPDPNIAKHARMKIERDLNITFN